MTVSDRVDEAESDEDNCEGQTNRENGSCTGEDREQTGDGVDSLGHETIGDISSWANSGTQSMTHDTMCKDATDYEGPDQVDTDEDDQTVDNDNTVSVEKCRIRVLNSGNLSVDVLNSSGDRVGIGRIATCAVPCLLYTSDAADD